MCNLYIDLISVQAQFSQMRPAVMAATVAPRMPIYPPGAPGLGQQIFYGQGPPAIIPPQVFFSFKKKKKLKSFVDMTVLLCTSYMT